MNEAEFKRMWFSKYRCPYCRWNIKLGDWCGQYTRTETDDGYECTGFLPEPWHAARFGMDYLADGTLVLVRNGNEPQKIIGKWCWQ